jgi:tetratricopeptide (TPR) repeat protein
VNSLSLLGVLVLLAQAAPARSFDCAALPGKPSIWDRARAPQVGRYCDLLAQAEARLALEPTRAEQAAKEADAALPGQAAPLVLRARAAFALARYAEAAALFRQARSLDPHAAEEPRALWALARSLRQTSDDRAAVAAFRALVPRANGLGSAEDRASALVHAGLAILAEGPAAVDEAVAVLRVASSPEAPSSRPLAQAALALALDRRGARAEAVAAASAATRAGALLSLERPAGRQSLGVMAGIRRDDALAIAARLKEASDAPGAISAWESFIASGGGGPWVEHARARVAELRKGGSGRRGR